MAVVALGVEHSAALPALQEAPAAAALRLECGEFVEPFDLTPLCLMLSHLLREAREVSLASRAFVRLR